MYTNDSLSDAIEEGAGLSGDQSEVQTKGVLEALPFVGAVTGIRDATRMAGEARAIVVEEHRAQQNGEPDPYPEYTREAHNEYLMLTLGYASGAASRLYGQGVQAATHVAFNDWAKHWEIPYDLQQRLAPNVPSKVAEEYIREHPGGVRQFVDDLRETGGIWLNTARYHNAGYNETYDEYGFGAATEATRRAIEHWRELRGHDKDVDTEATDTKTSVSAEEAVSYLASVQDEIGETVTLHDGSEVSRADVVERFDELMKDNAELDVSTDATMSTQEKVSAIVSAGMQTPEQVAETTATPEDELDYAV